MRWIILPIPTIILALWSAAAFTQGFDSGPKIVAVVPVRDGRSDQVSDELAGALREALGHQAGLKVVAAGTVDAIVQYQASPLTQALTPASAGSSSVEQLLAEAKARYFRFDNRGALTAARQAVAAAGDDGAYLVDALLTLAMANQALQDPAGVRAAMARLALAAPTYRVDPVNYPPSVVAAFNAAQLALAVHGVGAAEVASTPPAAPVFVNGIAAGVTPLTLRDLPAGVYQVEIRANRYQPVRQAVTIEPGRTIAVRGRLRWAKEGPVPPPPAPSAEIPAADARAEIVAGLRIAELTQADKVVAVNVDETSGGGGMITARVIDRAVKAGQPPISVQFSPDRHALHADLARMTTLVAQQAMSDPRHDPMKGVEPAGQGDPVLLGHRRRRVSPVVWGALGAGVVGGVLAAVFAGQGAGSTGGALQVSFR